MKTNEEIYIEEVEAATRKLGEQAGKILSSDLIRKFTLNCMTKIQNQEKQRLKEAILGMGNI